jgi:hypothetical protein
VTFHLDQRDALMPFSVSANLLAHSRAALWQREGLFWIVGGAGSGKTTVCEILSARFEILVYDMDAHVYGSFHARFTPERHPVNTAWTTSPDGLAWLLSMSWAEFDAFNRGALPEYVDLLREDLLAMAPGARLLVDGGICNPSLVAQVLPARRIVCLSRPGMSSEEVWTETAERASMKDELGQLANPEDAWSTFLEFDGLITSTILRECEASGITVCARGETESAEEVAARVAEALEFVP